VTLKKYFITHDVKIVFYEQLKNCVACFKTFKVFKAVFVFLNQAPSEDEAVMRRNIVG
jgi:hypothetical protein